MAESIKAILVDDEKQSRVVMRSLLEDFTEGIEIIGEAGNVEEAYVLVTELKPQLVFLDIQMPRANGFSLLKKYETVPFELIFVTSFDKYAINAIKFSALDYLLKPVEVSDLKEAISKAVRIIREKHNRMPQIVNLLHSLESNIEQKLALHKGDNVMLVNSSDILYIESDGSYCNVTTKDEKYVSSKYLKDFEDYFGEASPFVRIHKACLLNTRYIKSYSKGEPFVIEMINGQSFEVARRKKVEVLERFKIR